MAMKTTRGRVAIAVIVSVLVLVMTAIYIPGILTADKSKKEAMAISASAEIRNAQTTFRARMKDSRYGTIKELESSGLINAALESGRAGGYQFEIQVRDSSYEVFATPEKHSDCHGCRSFYMREAGKIHGEGKNGEKAKESDPILY